MVRRRFNLFISILIVLSGISGGFVLMPGQSQAQEVYDCGFNVTVDGYNFENYGSWTGTPGHCYGVSVTSVLFYLDMKERPAGVENTYDIEREDITKIIHSYQETWEEAWEDQTLARQITLNLHARYAELKGDIMAGEPSIVGVWAHSDLGGMVGHAMVAYKIEELGNNISKVYVYDPNYFYDGSNNHIQYLTLDLDRNEFHYSGNIGGTTYSDFEEFMVIQPQLSHSDLFWMDYWWLPWTGIAISILIVFLLAFFLVRRWKRQHEHRESVLGELNEELDEAQELDTETYYTEEEIEKKVTQEDSIPPGMIMCQNCKTLNPDNNKQCRLCAEELN